MSEKLTSGPWILKTDLFAGGISIVGQDGFEIYHDRIDSSVSEVTRNTILANASLMAASKDMYEALKCLLDEQNSIPLLRREKQYNEAVGRARVALAKADGKEATK